VALPRAAALRVASIERQISAPSRRRAAPGSARPASPPGVAGEATAPEPEPIETAAPMLPAAAPIDTPLPPPAAPPPPAVIRRAPSASEFIEPPPAAR
jgi:hypothetical protein